MNKNTIDLLDFWENQMKKSHTSSNYFFRKSPSHYHMMLLVMSAYKLNQNLSVEELKTKLFKTSRPKSALIINEACEKGFFFLEKTLLSLTIQKSIARERCPALEYRACQSIVAKWNSSDLPDFG